MVMELAQAINRVVADPPQGESALVELANIRGLLWKAYREVEAARAAATAAQARLDERVVSQQFLQRKIAFYENEAAKLEITDSDYDHLDMVPLDGFQATTDQPIDSMEPLELLAARVQDEEQRRLELFSRRVELETRKKELQDRVDMLRQSLKYEGAVASTVDSLVSAAGRVGEQLMR